MPQKPETPKPEALCQGPDIFGTAPRTKARGPPLAAQASRVGTELAIRGLGFRVQALAF